MNSRRVSVASLICSMLIAASGFAEVKEERRTKMEMPGVLGGIMKVFGGKSAREGVVSKVAVKGDRKMTVDEDTAELIDLAQEKMYQIDLKKKTYTVMTFEQIRQQMQQAMEQARNNPQAAPPQQTDGKPPDFTVDFSLKESGQKKSINGFDAREVVTTVTVRQKDKPADEGSMVMTSSLWLAPRIAALKELEDFDRRVAEKLYLPFAAEMAQQMAPAMGMYPGLKEAMGKFETEKVNMDGTSVLTVVRVEAQGNPDQPQKQPEAEPKNQQREIPTSLGGLLGGLGRKAASKNKKEDENNNPNKAALMTMNEELISVSTSVADGDVSIPAGFKEKK